MGDRDRVPRAEARHPGWPRAARPDSGRAAAQEVYALLVTDQALRTAISDATLDQSGLDPDRDSFTVPFHSARDQLVAAAGVIAGTVIDLVVEIGHQVRDHLMPARQQRTNPAPDVISRLDRDVLAILARGEV